MATKQKSIPAMAAEMISGGSHWRRPRPRNKGGCRGAIAGSDRTDTGESGGLDQVNDSFVNRLGLIDSIDIGPRMNGLFLTSGQEGKTEFSGNAGLCNDNKQHMSQFI